MTADFIGTASAIPSYRIVLSGAGGTGKTTLARMLSEELRLPLLPGAMRTMCKVLGFDGLALDPQKRAMLQSAALQFHKQQEWDNRFTGFVSDRARTCFCCYYNGLLHGEIFRADLIPAYERLAFDAPIRYDFLFYVPPFTEELVDDGFRYKNDMLWLEKYVRDHLPELVLTKYPNAIFLQSNTPEERMAEIRSVIKSATEKV